MVITGIVNFGEMKINMKKILMCFIVFVLLLQRTAYSRNLYSEMNLEKCADISLIKIQNGNNGEFINTLKGQLIYAVSQKDNEKNGGQGGFQFYITTFFADNEKTSFSLLGKNIHKKNFVLTLNNEELLTYVTNIFNANRHYSCSISPQSLANVNILFNENMIPFLEGEQPYINKNDLLMIPIDKVKYIIDKNLELEVYHNSVLLNSKPINIYWETFKNKDYISLRQLSNYIDYTISWDSKLKIAIIN